MFSDTFRQFRTRLKHGVTWPVHLKTSKPQISQHISWSVQVSSNEYGKGTNDLVANFRLSKNFRGEHISENKLLTPQLFRANHEK